MRRTTVLVLIAAFASACSNSPPPPPRDISSYLLSDAEKPKGTLLDAGDSGPETLAEYAKDDPIKRREMAAAGFVDSYFKLYISPDAISSGQLKPGSVLAISFALQFGDAQGAAKGLAALKAGIFREGKNLVERLAPKLGTASFELQGTLQAKKPPGYLIAWTFDRFVLGLIAVGAPGGISEQATQQLAAVMAAHSTG